MKILVGLCSKNHKNVVVTENTGENLAPLKKYAKALGAYFNRAPRCFVCKEELIADGAETFELKGDEATNDQAALSAWKVGRQ